MKLAFATPQLRQICESQLSAERQFGIAAAVELRGVLTALTIATDLHEFLMLYHDSIDGNSNGNYTLRFPAGIRIGLAANHSKLSTIAVGPVDPARVTRIRIDTLEVLDEE